MMNFQVGFGRICITPIEPVPLGGYGNTSRRISQTNIQRARKYAVTEIQAKVYEIISIVLNEQ